MKPKLLIFFLFVVFVTVWYFFIAPIFSDIKISKAEITRQKELLASKEKEIDRINSYEIQLKTLTEEKEKMKTILPVEPMTEELMVETEALVTKSGMILKGVNITPSNNNVGGVGDQAGVSKVSINLRTKGTYETLKNLMLLSQNDLRLMDITNISFSSPSQNAEKINGQTIYDFNINIVTYYY
ncbi:MAG: type 4a pilus biogenesis protein PilO [Candidatus Paceibacterota bacterium]|jgi:Tfp pilus assembly protein PilO